jgi:hypothetical protein
MISKHRRIEGTAEHGRHRPMVIWQPLAHGRRWLCEREGEAFLGMVPPELFPFPFCPSILRLFWGEAEKAAEENQAREEQALWFPFCIDKRRQDVGECGQHREEGGRETC